MSYEEIAERAGLSRSQVIRSLDVLAKRGWIGKRAKGVRQDGRNLRNEYCVLVPVEEHEELTGSTDATTERPASSMDATSTSSIHATSLVASMRPVLEQKEQEKNGRKEPAETAAPPAPAESPSVRPILDDFNELHGTHLNPSAPILAAAGRIRGDFGEYLEFAWSRIQLEKRCAENLAKALKDGDHEAAWELERVKREEAEKRAEREAELTERFFGNDAGELEEIAAPPPPDLTLEADKAVAEETVEAARRRLEAEGSPLAEILRRIA